MGHRQHRPFTELRLARGEAEAAIAQHQRGYAVPSGDRAIGIPADLGIVMGMQVDETRRDDKSVGKYHLLGKAWCTTADLRNLAVLDPKVGLITRDTSPIDDGSSCNLQIEFSHAQ